MGRNKPEQVKKRKQREVVQRINEAYWEEQEEKKRRKQEEWHRKK